MYTELSKPSLGSLEPYHVYGVVIDATLPYIKNNKYVCTLKIIDHTLNLKAASIVNQVTTNTYISVTFFGKTAE